MIGFVVSMAFGSVIATETILEYVIATYGREQIAALLADLGKHSSVETLIPAHFGLSRADFEAGWQRYLVERYGGPSSSLTGGR